VPKPIDKNINFKLAQNSKRYSSEIKEMTDREISYIKSPEYLQTRMNNTGESEKIIKKDIDNILKNVNKTTITGVDGHSYLAVGTDGEYSRKQIANALNPNPEKFFPSWDKGPRINYNNNGLYSEPKLSAIDHEIKHAFSPISTNKLQGESKVYKNYPTLELEQFKGTTSKHVEYLSKPEEQQVRFNKIKDYMEKTYGIKRGSKFTKEDVSKFSEDFNNNKLNSDTYGDVIDLLNHTKNQKGGIDLTSVLNKAWTVVPGAIGVGVASQLEQKKNGGVIKDNNGYWDPKNWGKTVEINSPDITMNGVNQPLLGTSKQTGEKRIMFPGENHKFANTKQVIETPLKGKWLNKYN